MCAMMQKFRMRDESVGMQPRTLSRVRRWMRCLVTDLGPNPAEHPSASGTRRPSSRAMPVGSRWRPHAAGRTQCECWLVAVDQAGARRASSALRTLHVERELAGEQVFVLLKDEFNS